MEPQLLDSVGYATMAIKSITEKSASGTEPGRFFSGHLNAHTVDREDEIFEPKGIETKAFMACGGPILVRHYGETTDEGKSCVVARVLSIQRREDGLFVNKAEFDTDELSEHYRGKVYRGFIRAMSAGLRRRDVEYRDVKGRQVRVVTRSELIHGVLTSQPINVDSLIASKSLDRIAALEKQLDALKSAAVPTERFEELSGSIERIFEQLAALGDALKSSSPDTARQQGMDRLKASLADLAKQAAQVARVQSAA